MTPEERPTWQNLCDQADDQVQESTALVRRRRVVDLALGILMERAQVSTSTAFALLRTQSEQRQVELHVVAEEVVADIHHGSASPSSSQDATDAQPPTAVER